VRHPTLENRRADRNSALAASSSLFLVGEFVVKEFKRSREAASISSIARKKAASLDFDGLLNPLTFLTNWRAAARISSSVTGGSKLNRVLMLLHITSNHRRGLVCLSRNEPAAGRCAKVWTYSAQPSIAAWQQFVRSATISSSTCRVDKKELNLTRRFPPTIGGDDGIAQKGFADERGGRRSDETQGALVDQQPARR
jgi:hypothetical protein